MTSRNSDRLRQFHMAVTSDWHVGHVRLDPQEQIKNIDENFPDNDVTGELDMIIIAGDVYDDLLSLNSDAGMMFALWIASFMRMCERRDIALRVLLGTRSHDWDQPLWFNVVHEMIGSKCDFAYIPELTVRHEPRWNLNFLYIPDDLHHDHDLIHAWAKSAVESAGLKQVDYAIMHGTFTHQLPPGVHIPHHTTDEYLKLVKNQIFAGHHHSRSKYKDLYVQGSLNCIAHGEEHQAKGHYRTILYNDQTSHVYFVPNPGAKQFRSVELTDMDMERSFVQIRKVADELPEDSYIRIVAVREHPVFSYLRLLMGEYPLLNWSSKEIAKKEEVRVSSTLTTELEYTPIVINELNLVQLVMDRVNKVVEDDGVLEASARILKEIA